MLSLTIAISTWAYSLATSHLITLQKYVAHQQDRQLAESKLMQTILENPRQKNIVQHLNTNQQIYLNVTLSSRSRITEWIMFYEKP